MENINKKSEIKLKNEDIFRSIKFVKTITTDLFTNDYFNNKACFYFNELNKNNYIVYGNNSLNLEFYNIDNQLKNIIIEGLHEDLFVSCKSFDHHIITTSLDNHLKIVSLLEINNSLRGTIELDYNFESLKGVIINTSFFLNSKIFIPLSSSEKGVINIYNSNFLNTNKISEKIINVGFVLSMTSFYDEKNEIDYLLVSNKEGIFTYDLQYYNLYFKFIPQKKESNNKEMIFDEPCIIKKDDKVILVGNTYISGYFFFWNFYDKTLMNVAKSDLSINNICLWDNNYIFASFNNNQTEFGLINLNDMSIEEIQINENNLNFGKGKCVKLSKAISSKKINYLISISYNGKLNLYKIVKK